jgi:hypothetical protein
MSNVRLSETERGCAWLENFVEDDRGIATLLLDSLRIVPSGEFRDRLMKLTSDIAAMSRSPVALYPVRPQPPDLEENQYLEPDVDRPYPPDAGSEHLVANLLRDVARQGLVEHKVLNIPSLEELKIERCRTIILVDDYAGSGDSASRHLLAWLRNPTICSWLSYKLIEFAFIAFTVSSSALRELSKHAVLRDRIHYVEYGHDFKTARWSPDERVQVTALCRKYASRNSCPLGWNRTAGLFAVAHTVPDNLPAVLRQEKGHPGRPWTPLLVRSRGMPPEHVLSSFGPRLDLPGLAARFGQRRLARTVRALPKGVLPLLLVVLAALARSRRDEKRLVEDLGLPLYEVADLLELAARLRLIDPNSRRLTDEGWEELRRARTRQAVPTPVRDNAEPYYPRSLRGGW